MKPAERLLPNVVRRQIEVFWDMGLDSAKIAFLLKLDEWLVAPVISEYVTAKKLRKSPF